MMTGLPHSTYRQFDDADTCTRLKQGPLRKRFVLHGVIVGALAA